jgi:hypothetical protein
MRQPGGDLKHTRANDAFNPEESMYSTSRTATAPRANSLPHPRRAITSAMAAMAPLRKSTAMYISPGNG